MKILKLIPFYLFLILNLFVAMVLVVDYFGTINDQGVMWGAEPMGWQYKSRVNYTALIFITLVILIAPSVYALQKIKVNIKKAYFVVVIPSFVCLINFMYYIFFFNI